MSISYSPVVESPQFQTVAAPSRLELKQSRTQEVGRRILGLLARLALESRASRLWLVSEEQTIVALGKRDDEWSVLMKHTTFHANAVLDAIEELSPNGVLTVESHGVASLWQVSFGRVEGGEEVLLVRL
jgi:hypothetical protein